MCKTRAQVHKYCNAVSAADGEHVGFTSHAVAVQQTMAVRVDWSLSNICVHSLMCAHCACVCVLGTCPERWTLWFTTCLTRTLAVSPTLRSEDCLNRFVSWERYKKTLHTDSGFILNSYSDKCNNFQYMLSSVRGSYLLSWSICSVKSKKEWMISFELTLYRCCFTFVAGDWAASHQPWALPESGDHPPERLSALRTPRSVDH